MSVRGFSELVLVVKDVPRATAFYRDAVGLTLESEPKDDWAWFLLSEDPVQRLALAKGPLLFEEKAPRSPAFGAVHYALRVERDDLPAALDRLRTHGVEVLGPTHFEWMNAQSHYFYDPDGNLGEFWTPL